MKAEDIPGDSSGLKKYIPPNEEIEYDTHCQTFLSKSHITSGIIKDTFTGHKISYLTPFIITPLGFAYYCKPSVDLYHPKSPWGDPLPTYNSLLNIIKFRKNGFIARHIDPIQRYPYEYDFAIVQDNVKEFKLILVKYMKNAAEYLLNYLKDNKNREEKDFSPLWKVNKSIVMENYDPDLHEYLNSDEDLKDAKKRWDFLNRSKVSARTRFESREEYLNMLKKTMESYAYKNGNVAYIRPLINSELEVKAHLHLEEFHTKTSHNMWPTGVTPTSDNFYRSLFHKKAEKKLLGTIASLDKFIQKAESS